MSCSITSNLLRYCHCNRKSNQQYTTPDMPVIILVFCACMIALQGSSLESARIVMTQKQSDTVTEHIGITQKQLFLNFKSETNSRG